MHGQSTIGSRDVQRRAGLPLASYESKLSAGSLHQLTQPEQGLDSSRVDPIKRSQIHDPPSVAIDAIFASAAQHVRVL